MSGPALRWPRRMVVVFVVIELFFWGAVFWVEFPLERLAMDNIASLTITDAGGVVLRRETGIGGFKETWVSLEDISPHLIHATLASEDNAFYEHGGVDWLAMGRAVWLNFRRGKMAYGGSTIPMQLARLTTGVERTLSGKLHQMFLAKNLVRVASKDDILEQYLNRIYYGNGNYGAEQAALFYFDKHAKDLSVGEGAMLAVIPRGPRHYNPFGHWDRVDGRWKRILDLMHKHGYIDEAARELAKRTPLELTTGHKDFRAPHFVHFARERLPRSFATGATVRTTLDWPLQQRMERLLAGHVDRLSWRNLKQAALVVMRNRDGAILSMVGSRSYWNKKNRGAYNGSTARLRPGSTLKPFVYATAFERGDTPSTIAYDVILPEEIHQFYTKDVRSHGFARYRESLAGSFNLSAVHTLQRVGKNAVLKKLRDAGLSTLDKPDDAYDWGLAIGHAEVRLIDLVSAFSTFGRGGRPVAPRVIERAERTDGKTWEEVPEIGKRVFSEEISYLIFDILSDPDARRPMFGDSVPMHLPFKVALKTGTTKAYTDLWAVGTTPEYTVGVWAGNFDGSPTHRVRSVQGATPLISAAYTDIAARFGAPSAPRRPSGIVDAHVCPVSGKLPGPYCHHKKHELFLKGHLPDETCDWHQKVCGEVQVVYPKPLRGWAEALGRDARSCDRKASDDEHLRIISPKNGSVFVLEPHRPPRLQKPILKALPHNDVRLTWRIDGEPADRFIPSPGEHLVQVSDGDRTDMISIVYER